MDSKIALALMAKVRLVFESEGAFLSFPLTPCAFTRRELTSVASRNYSGMTGTEAVQALRQLAEFSTLVNLVPTGAIWPPLEARHVWDAYDRVLRDMRLAASGRTPAEEAEYRTSWSVLHRVAGDGAWGDTEAFRTYLQFRDYLDRQTQKYHHEKVKWENASAPADRQRWHDRLEPAYQRGLRQIEEEWVRTGFKRQVETAQQTLEQLGGKSPLLTWRDWRGTFDRDLDLLTDPDTQQRFAPTTFSPSNALGEHSWMKFSLSGPEVNGLISQAPVELRQRLAAGPLDPGLDTLSFDCTSVVVTRPWLKPEVFTARCWDVAPPPLSDGRAPAQGTLPAYVTGLVLGRNLQIVTKPGVSPGRLGAARPAPATGWSLAGLAAEPDRAPERRSRAGTSSISLAQAEAALAVARRVFRTPVSDFHRGEPGAAPVRAMARSSGEAADTECINLLAFVCKRVPRCPDPDRTLDWSDPMAGPSLA